MGDAKERELALAALQEARVQQELEQTEQRKAKVFRLVGCTRAYHPSTEEWSVEVTVVKRRMIFTLPVRREGSATGVAGIGRGGAGSLGSLGLNLLSDGSL